MIGLAYTRELNCTSENKWDEYFAGSVLTSSNNIENRAVKLSRK